MRSHPYLRAYMGGIVVPTLFLLVIMLVDAYNRYYFEVPSQFVLGLPARPLERAILFPMAVVPNAWGVWNMLYLALRRRVRLPLGSSARCSCWSWFREASSWHGPWIPSASRCSSPSRWCPSAWASTTSRGSTPWAS